MASREPLPQRADGDDSGESAGKFFVVLACFKQGVDPGGSYRGFVERNRPQLVQDLAQLQKISREFLSDGNRRKRVALARDMDQDSDSEIADSPSLFSQLPAAAEPDGEATPVTKTRHRRRRTEEKTAILVGQDPFGGIDKFNERENKKRALLRKDLNPAADGYKEKHAQLEMQSRYHWYIASVIGPWQYYFAAERFSVQLKERSRSLMPRASLADIMANLQDTPVPQFVAARVICGKRVNAHPPSVPAAVEATR